MGFTKGDTRSSDFGSYGLLHSRKVRGCPSQAIAFVKKEDRYAHGIASTGSQGWYVSRVKGCQDS